MSKKEDETGTKAYTIRIRGKALEQVEQLKAKTQSNTVTEVVKNALRTYSAIQSSMDTDGSIVIERPDGKKVRLMVP